MTNASPGSSRFVLSFAFLLALVVVLIVLAHQTFRALSSANRGSLHTYQVLTATDQVQQGVAEMEAGFRGYALTRAPRFLEQWQRGLRAVREREEGVRALTDGDSAQQRRLAEAQAAFRAWMALQAASGVLRPETPRDAAIAAAADPAGLARRGEAVERARRLLNEMEAAESVLLRERAARAAALERRTRQLLTAGSVLAVGMALVTGVLVDRRTRRLAELNRELEREVAERARARDALARMSRQNELILDAAAEGIYGVDEQGHTQFLNPAAARMLRRPPDEAIGRPLEAVLGMDGPPDEAGPVRATLRSGVGQQARDAVFRRADGEPFPVEFASTPILEDGRITGAVVTFRDVTERREVERLKDEFVSVVSHELRTPLTSIRGSLGLLAAGKAGPVPEQGRRMLEIAVQNTDRLVRLINDILDIERIESGRVAMEMRSVDAGELARQAADVMAAMAAKAGVRLSVNAGPQPLQADPDRVLQVLTNLLSNAIKFSPPGGEVSLVVEAGDGEAVFRVADQGRGIPADRLESIFERFSQVDSSDAREKGGTGLGLAISRSIVQQHGGRIRARSTPGRGSTFTFTLPSTPPGEPVQPAPEPGRSAGPLILVCDDDPAVLAVVEEMLRQWGYRTEGVPDGESAVRQALRLRPDAILLDMMMPGMSGSETLRALRGRPETRSIPVVILSALKPMPRVRQAAEVVDWVEKPFHERGLLHALEEAVSVRWKPRRVLLVEDDADLAGVLLEVFGRHGIEALHAATGVDAVEQARRAAPDLLVLDLGLPHGDGYWVVESLREDEALRGIPLVVYTARELEGDDRARLRLGETEFLTKGRVSPDEFEKRVVSLLNRIAPARPVSVAP